MLGRLKSGIVCVLKRGADGVIKDSFRRSVMSFKITLLEQTHWNCLFLLSLQAWLLLLLLLSWKLIFDLDMFFPREQLSELDCAHKLQLLISDIERNGGTI